MSLKSLIFVSCFIFANSIIKNPTPAHAEAFPWRSIHSSDIRVIDNARVEAQYRLHAMRSATKTLDIIDYDLGGDAIVAKPFLDETMRAADRGVKVRFLRGGFISKLLRMVYLEPSWSDPVESRLFSHSTREPIQYLFFGGWRMLWYGWSLFAGVHEKLIIIDGKLALMTGRGLSKQYLHFLDTCTVFRGPMVADAQQGFENLWETVQTVMGAEPTTFQDLVDDDGMDSTADTEPNLFDLPENRFDRKWDSSPDLRILARPKRAQLSDPELYQKSARPLSLPLGNQELALLMDLKRWEANATPNKSTDPTPEQSTDAWGKEIPAHQFEGRFIHHNLLVQLQEKCANVPWFYGYAGCSGQIEDPMISELVNLVKTAKSVKFYTTGLVLNDTLKQALVDRLQEAREKKRRPDLLLRDFEVKIFTNSKESFDTFIPLFANAAWIATLGDIRDLRALGAEVYAFKRTPTSELKFLHRKGVIVGFDHAEPIVFTGSSNWNETSSIVDDEMIVEIKSRAIGAYFDRLFEEGIHRNGALVGLDEINEEYEQNQLFLRGWNRFPWNGILSIVRATL